jgi:transposase
MRNKIILLDNARSHRYGKFKEDIAKSTHRLVYNIPYHPQTNPIEYINNVIKNDLKKKNISNITTLKASLQRSLKLATPNILKNCFDKAFENMN